MAQSLASGRGFSARFLYDFQQAHLSLPNTGIEYWRPGISLLFALLAPLHSIDLFFATAITTFVAVLYAAAAWHIARRTTCSPLLTLGSFALCLLSNPAWIGSDAPDSSLFYGAAIAWFLALFTVRRQGLLADLLALLCLAAAYLIRNDALLLLFPFSIVLWCRSRQSRHSTVSLRTGSSRLYTLLMFTGFFAALAPMHLLYHAVLGTAFPSGTSRVFFLHDLGDFVRYDQPVGPHSLLAGGIRYFLLFRLQTLAAIAYRVPVLMVGYPALVMLPGLLVRPVHRTHSATPSSVETQLPEFAGTATFALTLLAVYGLVLPAIGGFSALRSATGLMPFYSVLVLVAIDRLARDSRIATLLASAVIAANALAGFMQVRHDIDGANATGSADRSLAAHLGALGGAPVSDLVMTGDPVQFSVTTGYAAVQLPINGPAAILAAARIFRPRYVLLDSDSPEAASPDVLARSLNAIRSLSLPQEHVLLLELPHPNPIQHRQTSSPPL